MGATQTYLFGLIKMNRRYISELPMSRLAIWSRHMAWFALATTVIAIFIVRSDFLEERFGLPTLGGALAFAVVAVLFAFAAFVVIWRDGLSGIGAALTGIFVSLALLAYPAYLVAKAYKLPRIYDITTDPIKWPEYEQLARMRSRDTNPAIYAGLASAELQRAAYPDIETIEHDASPRAAYNGALAVLTKRKWSVINKRPPDGRRDGIVEAVVRSPIMGFRDDVVVRIRPGSEGSLIDIRSSSRYGTFDFGSNAQRVRALIDEIDNAIVEEKPEPVAPVGKKQLQPQKAPPPKTSQAPSQAPSKR
jgi:uncharacterized protein (DUF1499 family)